MGIVAPTYVTVNPHFMEPQIIVAQSQRSGAFELLPGGQPKVKISDSDVAVYIKRLDIRTKVASGQFGYNMLPTVEPVFSYGSTPTYLTRCQAIYDGQDTSAAGRWGVGLQQVYRLGMWQAHFNVERTALLYGLNPATGEGLANASAAYSVNLPADTSGNTTISTYDNGQMAQFLLQLIGAIKTRTNTMGVAMEVSVLAPQRVLQQWYYNIVQVVQYQRPGAGTESTAGVVKLVAQVMGDIVKWNADDTLIGKGSGGTDLIMFVMPELEKVEGDGQINTNIFANITPNMPDNVTMYTDMVAPMEITVPQAQGKVDVMSQHRISAGWPLRGEAITLLSAAF